MEKVAKFIILVCLFISCEKEYEKPKRCYSMTISNSIPIQFWVNGEQTFNTKDVCGVTSVCWCQPFECADEITIQFRDTTGQTNILIISNSGVITYLPFTEIATGLYEITFTANEQGLCNKQPEFHIRNYSGVGFMLEADQWTEVLPFDSRTEDSFVNSTASSQVAYQPLVANNGDTITINYTVTISGIITGAADVDFILTDSSGTPISTITETPYQSTFGSDGVYPITIIKTIDSVTPAARLYLGTSYIGSGVPTITIEITPLELINPGESSYKASSDCVSFKETHPCTVLVNYANATEFDGVADSSPIQSFNLRIPAIFFEEENTQEQEDIELSNDEIVRLYSKVEEKRLLRIGFMPHYMHRKLLLALTYDFVEIDDKYWIKRDEYKKNEGDRHYPLKTGQVLLTDKNFIKENQL